ncbi:hypothetical protein F0562_032210 [Nyssa sinensis]|uniref:RIN4 pathogenic type III effector avirulence factor Avr cleavage site domain-containing protein n=1 Tax=Nyssa sinensis TaxID=561372 RepID=A0A5J5AUU6_9ASTE|nr:hypothetical protein F0562_032210 [Nyssa sinensis]
MDECKRSGQIPAFGNWDYANDVPITQYFECARQAGLLRFTSSSGECNLHVGRACTRTADLYALHLQPPPKKKGSNCNVKEQMSNQIKVCDVTEAPRKQVPKQNNNIKAAPVRHKAVDEDLYKISPDLLHTSKRKKLLGYFSRCLGGACMKSQASTNTNKITYI